MTHQSTTTTITQYEADHRAWRYQKDIPQDLAPLKEAWTLLETYSGIPPDKVEAHVRELRDKAFAIHPYPCIGRWRFLNLYLVHLPIYKEVIARLSAPSSSSTARTPVSFLDAGCCFGQVLRQVAVDSQCDQENLYGADLEQEFIDLGYELFKDRDSFKAKFYTGNMLNDAEDGDMKQGLDGKIDIIHAASLFHLFGWDDQVTLGLRLVRMFKPDAHDAVLFGRQVGSDEPQDLEEHRKEVRDRQAEQGAAGGGPGGGAGGAAAIAAIAGAVVRYHHDPVSLQKLWDEIGSRSGTKWKTESELAEFFPEGNDNVARTGIMFVIRRVSQ